jgi:hypothetical protein
MWTGPSPKPEPSPVVSPPPAIVPPPAPVPVIVSAPPPPPVVMPTPAIGQAQAAQVPVVVPRPVPTPVPQEAVARGAPEPGVPAMAATLPMRSDTQVFVRANSWLELRSPAGDILAQTYVRAGESYTVPAGISYRVIDAR